MKKLSFIALFVLLSMASCQQSQAKRDLSGISSQSSRSEEYLEFDNEIIQQAITPEENLPANSAIISDAPSAEEDILKFSFPTPAVEPISLWRPPLYEVPWALSPFDHFYFTRPIAADEINWPLPNYRYGGIFFGTDIVHTGIDIPAPRGATVIAAGNGKVIWAGFGLFYGNNNPEDPYGLAISIEHDFGYEGKKLYTIYAHLDRIDVLVGQEVKTGTPLGLVGLTGKTTGPHLHFEVRIEDNSFYSSRNPELWIAPPQGWGVLAGDFQNTNGSFLSQHTVNIQSLETNQKWQVITYGPTTVHKDDYYQENMVIGDLPAGVYEVSLEYLDEDYESQISIRPGAVTFITFKGKYGFGFNPPSTPSPQLWLGEEANSD